MRTSPHRRTRRRVSLRLLAALAAAVFAAPCVWAQGALAPGDFVFVDVPRNPEFTTSGEVDAQGNITVPMIGPVHVGGKTEAEATAAVHGALQKMLRNPRVTVSRTGTALYESYGRQPQMRTEIIPLNNSQAGELSEQLLGMSSDGGAISYHADTNALLITDTPDVIQNMMAVIARLDEMQSQMTQVRIEAKIAEVKAGALKELGVRWFTQDDKWMGGYHPGLRQNLAGNSAFGNSGSSDANEARLGNSSGGGSSGQQFVDGGIDRRLQIPLQVAQTGQFMLGFFDGTVDIGAMVDALVGNKKAELLANPNVMTVNHKTATIEMVDEFPLTEFGTESSGRSTTNVRFVDIGIKLEVTPHVYRDQAGAYVEMQLNPDVSFPSGVSNGAPIISRRAVQTVAQVRDGQTLVIGGIYRNDMQDAVSKVPLLGELPLLGTLFKRTESSTDKTELMVFVTPSIYTAPEAVTWDRMIDVTDPWAESTADGAAPGVSVVETRRN